MPPQGISETNLTKDSTYQGERLMRGIAFEGLNSRHGENAV